jgi:DNA invertase Pin-like site-specific DNA recombinase
VTAITVQVDDEMAELLRRLAAARQRSETEIVREALAAYVQAARPVPKGMGKYRSGQAHVSERARDIVREADSVHGAEDIAAL